MPYPGKYLSKDFVIMGNLIRLADQERIWQTLDKGVRTSVRKGRKMGVNIRPLEREDTRERAALAAITPNHEDIPETFSDRYHGYVAEKDVTHEILGWILLVAVAPHKLFMLCHASTKAGKEHQTPNLLLWHAIQAWCDGPYPYLDVGGSFRSSLQRYFSGFRDQTYPLILHPPALPLDVRITPFDTAAYAMEPGDAARGRAWLCEQFQTDAFTVFPRAAYAIAGCLRELREEGRLCAEDEVFVTTTTDTPYISSCVTGAIEQVCRWSQTPSERTRAVFLIHEFGFPHPQAATWRAFCDERKIPLIEDCAYGWGSEGAGIWGDYKIYSATKLWPVQFGGFLVGRDIPFDRLWHTHQSADAAKQELLYKLMDAWHEDAAAIRKQRQRVWQRYQENLASVSAPCFDLPETVLPGAYLARMPSEEKAKEVKAFVEKFGIEVGSWYHHSALFLPCHQRLSARHVDFISSTVMACFRESCGVPMLAKH